MSREEDFQNFLQRSQAERKSEEQRRNKEGLPNFKLNFCDLLEGENFPDVADLEQPEQDSSQELESFISAEKSANTVKKTKSEWKQFENYCQEQPDGTFHVETVPADVLDKLLGKFFKDVRKRNGAEYEPDSISSFQLSIHRHLKELKFPFNILQGKSFQPECRRSLLWQTLDLFPIVFLIFSNPGSNPCQVIFMNQLHL